MRRYIKRRGVARIASKYGTECTSLFADTCADTGPNKDSALGNLNPESESNYTEKRGSHPALTTPFAFVAGTAGNRHHPRGSMMGVITNLEFPVDRDNRAAATARALGDFSYVQIGRSE